MGKLSSALKSIVSEVSVVVGPKTTTKAIVCTKHSINTVSSGVSSFAKQSFTAVNSGINELAKARLERKELFNRLNS